MKVFVFVFVAFFIANTLAGQYITGDGDDEDVIINVRLPSCCSGSGGPPAPTPTPTPSPSNPELVPVGLIVSGNDAISQIVVGVANMAINLLNEQYLKVEGSPYLFGNLTVRATGRTAVGAEAAVVSLAAADIHYAVGPLYCEEQEGARQALRVVQDLILVAPGVVGNCAATHSHDDGLFLLGSTDYWLAKALGTVAGANNIYLVSNLNDVRGDSIFTGLTQNFSPGRTIRRLRFAAGGGNINNVRNKIIEDLAVFSPNVSITVIFALEDLELARVFPLLREQSRFTQYLTANVDTLTFTAPALSALRSQLVSLNFAGVVDYLPTHISFYQQLQFAFNILNANSPIPLPLNALTALRIENNKLYS
eukprot:TRINITY_DN5589_c0_g1_i1.p1 TRINITY_DN5589_c0_g1~~TRINITY_DN5589_c0_g1_i1.p1  ORF type:complete len:365 (+),score=88.47 TRINITY_DN5589_c0_g1_i1:85-1179(+)